MTMSLMVDMQVPQWVAKFNKYVTNPVQRLWAPYLPGFGLLLHVGRKSGRHFRTPLNVFATDEGLAVLLTYGPNRDWLKNVTAAGSAQIRRAGKTVTITEPHVMPKAEAASHVVGFWKPIFARLPFESAVLFKAERTS
jgi:deazaflavin-dependent oxidoreductase (nitroreductase family)